jgi:hypothetical protein
MIHSSKVMLKMPKLVQNCSSGTSFALVLPILTPPSKQNSCFRLNQSLDATRFLILACIYTLASPKVWKRVNHQRISFDLNLLYTEHSMHTFIFQYNSFGSYVYTGIYLKSFYISLG